MTATAPASVRTRQLFIDGQWADAQSGQTFDVRNPSTGAVIARVAAGDREDTRRAIGAARRAFDNGLWTNMSAESRMRILLRIVKGLRERTDELAELEALNGGSPIRKTSLMDVPLALEHFHTFAEMAEKPPYEPLPWNDFPGLTWNFVLREPIGVCGQIIPWNLPLLMAVWKVAPALAAGNTVVLKPASYTPLTALLLAEVIAESDLPKGVFNLVTGQGAIVGEELAANPMVDKIAFTGSTVVGRRVMQLASATVKKTTLELGGKSPNIILPDADVELAVDGSLFATFFHAGQLCESGTRLLLPDNLYEPFMERLLARARTIRVGDALDYETTMGPLVSETQLHTVEEYVKLGVHEGAEIAIGGERLTTPAGGYFHQPTIFTNVNNQMRIAREEIFGPVLSVIRYHDLEEAVAIANDSDYGLGAAVWSRNVPAAIEVAKKIRSGTVWINDYHLLSATAPFGGYKQSGIGRELGSYGFNEYTEIKHVHVDLGSARGERFWYDLVVGDEE